MLLGEPPRTQGDLNFAVLGIPVRIHPMFWLMALLFTMNRSPQEALIWAGALLASILVHELGHATVIRSMGFHPWIVLHGFGGLAVYNPAEPYARRPGHLGQILISLAGPGAGFLLTGALVLGLAAAGHKVLWSGPARLQVVPTVLLPDHLYLTVFLADVFFISVFWGLINLLPVYPLDGGQISMEILLAANPRDGMRQALMLSILTAGTLAGISLVQWHDWFIAILFGYLAYGSYTMLQTRY